MIETPTALNGRVDHVDTVGHGDDQHVVLHRLGNAAQELGYFLDAVMTRTHLTVSQEGFHLVDHEDGRRVLHRLVEHLRDLLAGLVDVGAGDAGGVDLETWPAEEVHQPVDSEGFAATRRAMQDQC